MTRPGLVFPAFAVVCLAALLSARADRAARLVRAKVSYDGQVVLRGSTSDDGHPDADAVWTYLRRMRLTPTDAFAKVAPAAAEEGFEMLGIEDPAQSTPRHTFHEASITLEVAYGGRVTARKLRLLRVPAGDGNPVGWRVDPAEIDRLFEYRWITRRQAGQLDAPSRRR